MGPNCLRIADEFTKYLPLSSDMRILDLGCGKGLTSIYLAEKFGLQVFAVDLMVEATDNYSRFQLFNLEDKIIPIQSDAKNLPFAENYFDAVISIDAYQYFGSDSNYLDEQIVPMIKKGGMIAATVPGLQRDFLNGIPSELKPFWQENMNFYSAEWWEKLWKQSRKVELQKCFSLSCHKEAWIDWLKCENPYAKRDIKMMEAEGGKYFDTIGLIAAYN